jgi:hypothetical protein
MDMDQPAEELLEPEAPVQPEAPVKPERPKRRPDPAGQAWHRDAGHRWARAAELVPDDPLSVYDPVPLPAWTAAAHVHRELFGRYVADRDTGVVHDVQHALEECGVDAIRNATFYHFESELPDELVDCACMEG